MSSSPEPGTATAPVPAAPLRVLAVTNLWPTGDSFRGVFVREQVTALRRRGHQVDVEVVAQGRGKADYLLAAARVRRLAATGGYHVVHAHYGLTGLATRLVGVPRVLSLYGSDVNARRQRWFTRLGWGGTAARIYVSRRLAATAGDRAGHVIPNGVDFGVFTPGDRAAARAALGLDPDTPVVLFGALPTNPVKCYDVFTDVLAALRERGVAARELALSAPGQSQPELVAKFAAADVLLFTSRQGSEGSPTVVKEACAMGLPVVSVDVGDAAEMLAGVTPSAVVEFPADRAALVDRLAGATAAVLAAGTRSDGRTRNAWLDSDRVAARIEAVYREVLGR
jgi:glycosyltransferase involved in cell wall biosynthesis